MTSHTLIRAVAPSCGAEVVGIDLPRSVVGDDVADPASVGRPPVLFVREQCLTPDQQVEFTGRFGEVLSVPYIKPLDGHPDVIAVLKEPDERNISTFGGTWHSDFSFLDQPPSLTLLYTLELPEVGGDTLWSSQYVAYETLSAGMQRLLDPLRAVHTAWPHGTKGPAVARRSADPS